MTKWEVGLVLALPNIMGYLQTKVGEPKKSILINFQIQLTSLELLYLKTISFAPRYKRGKK